MIKVDSFDVTLIRDITSPVVIENAKELIPQKGEISSDITAIIKRHHLNMAAGIGKHEIYGITCKISIETSYPTNDLDIVIKSVYKDLFGEANCLSIKVKEENRKQQYTVTIYPQVGRILNPEKWFDLKRDETGFVLKNENLKIIFAAIEQTFNEKPQIAPEIGFIDLQGKEFLADVDLISDMTFPEYKKSDYEELIYDATGSRVQKIRQIPNDRYQSLLKHAIEYFTVGVERSLFEQAQIGTVTEEAFMSEVTKFIKRMEENIVQEDLNDLLQEIYTAIFGNYIIEDLLNADNVSDIKIYNPWKIRVKVNGTRMTANVAFMSADDYLRFYRTLQLRYGVSGEYAINRRTDKDSNTKFIMRINITTPEINSSGWPMIHIRKIKKEKATCEDLIRMQVMPRKVCEYLKYKFNTSSILVCGKGGSGKTTLVNTMLEEISFNASGLISQESDELFVLRHPDIAVQHTTQDANGEEKYALQDEAKNGLLIDLDYFIIGEIKGGEALYFLNAAATGHKCICTIHAPNAAAAIDKMADYVMYESKYDKAQAMYMLQEMKTLIFMEKFKVKEIVEVIGWDEEAEKLIFRKVYQAA